MIRRHLLLLGPMLALACVLLAGPAAAEIRLPATAHDRQPDGAAVHCPDGGRIVLDNFVANDTFTELTARFTLPADCRDTTVTIATYAVSPDETQLRLHAWSSGTFTGPGGFELTVAAPACDLDVYIVTGPVEENPADYAADRIVDAGSDHDVGDCEGFDDPAATTTTTTSTTSTTTTTTTVAPQSSTTTVAPTTTEAPSTTATSTTVAAPVTTVAPTTTPTSTTRGDGNELPFTGAGPAVPMAATGVALLAAGTATLSTGRGGRHVRRRRRRR